MRTILEINIAVWGMLACSLLGLAQYFNFLFQSASHLKKSIAGHDLPQRNSPSKFNAGNTG